MYGKRPRAISWDCSRSIAGSFELAALVRAVAEALEERPPRHDRRRARGRAPGSPRTAWSQESRAPKDVQAPRHERGGHRALRCGRNVVRSGSSWSSRLTDFLSRVDVPEILEGDDELEASSTSWSAAQSSAIRMSSRSARTRGTWNGSSSSSVRWAERAIASMRSAWRRRTASASGDSQLLGGELADRLEHPESLLAEAADAARSEALVEQRLERLQVGVADRLGRLERAAAAKTARRAKSACSSAASRS